MHFKFMVILFVFSLASCKCGLLNWLSGWTDELNSKEAKIKCREKREPEENKIKSEITKSGADNIVSLRDIEEGDLTTKSDPEPKTEVHQGNPKAKRCHKSPVVGAARKIPKLLPLVKRDLTSEERCNACTNRPPCKLLGACAQCNEDCKGIAIFTDDLLRPWTNQSVGMVHRMVSPKKDDIFSKTLYPVSTFREGDTKDIICRIVGITDTSDIETITIWVTTLSNKPPKSLVGDSSSGTPKKTENTLEQNLRTSEAESVDPNKISGRPALFKPSLKNGQGTPSKLHPRFNEDGDNRGMEKIKANPDVIEGPPPFLRSENVLSATKFPLELESNNLDGNYDLEDGPEASNKPIIVQPKEFLSDDSSDDDNDDLFFPSSQPIKESTTTKTIVKPALLNRLRELATSRINRFSDLKDRQEKVRSDSPAKGVFRTNILKPRPGATDNNSKMVISTPSSPKSFQDAMKNTERVTAIENQSQSVKLPSESDDQIAKINDAIQEVKTMVKNIQEEASKGSEKRLLGASLIADSSNDIGQGNIAAENTPSYQIGQALPSHVVDNLKKVNSFFVNRAQDALDMIKSQEKEDRPSQLTEVGRVGDEHSTITKNTINNFKKMPQFLLERFKDTLKGFENKEASNMTEESTKENIILNEIFGDNVAKKIDVEGNLPNSNIRVGSSGEGFDDDRNDSLVGLSEQNVLENESIPKSEIQTTKTYKNKLEKYLAELKEKRQKIYSPDKYLKSPSTKSNQVLSLAKGEEVVDATLPSTADMLNLGKTQVENKIGKTSSNILMSPNEKQGELLRQKLRKFINDVKLKTSSSVPLTKIVESTSPLSEEVNINSELIPTDNRYTDNIINPLVEQQSLPKPALKEEVNTVALSNPSLSQNSLPENTDQMVGKISNPLINNMFLPTISTLPTNGINQNAPSPNKFQKYLEDLRTKQSELLKQKKPLDVTVGQPDMSLDQRMSDQISSLNNKVKSDMKNIFGSSTPDVFKKNALQEKLKNYIDSLKKPMERKLVPDLVRKSSEAQREEINSLKIKLENLLKGKELVPSGSLGENPLVSKGQPNIDPSNEHIVSDNIVPIMNRARTTDIENNGIVGDTHQINDETSLNSQLVENRDINLQSKEAEDGADILDWSHNLGKIVQSSSKSRDIFFIGSGIKLPLQVTQGPNGSMDLSVDLEKLCSCYNTTCPKNHTAIEETVGAILEKEAELNEQLKNDTLDVVKIEPLFANKPTTLPKLLNPVNSGIITRKRKSNIFKRSSDIKELNHRLTPIKTVLTRLKRKNERNMKNDLLKDVDLPKLPTLDTVAEELANLGKTVQDSVTNSVQQLQNNVKELKEELEDTNIESNKKSNLLLNQNLPAMPTYDSNWFKDNLNEMQEKVDEINNNVLEKLEQKSSLNTLLNENELKGDYIKAFKPDVMYNKMLQNLNQLKLPTENSLNVVENQVNEAIRKLEQRNNINKLMEKADLTKYQLPKIPAYLPTKDPLAMMNQFEANLKKSIPAIPDLQNKMNDINGDLFKVTGVPQLGKANYLENKLRQLDNEVKKYYDKNEKLLAEESKKLLGSNNSELIEKEVTIVNKIISWIKSLASGTNL